MWAIHTFLAYFHEKLRWLHKRKLWCQSVHCIYRETYISLWLSNMVYQCAYEYSKGFLIILLKISKCSPCRGLLYKDYWKRDVKSIDTAYCKMFFFNAEVPLRPKSYFKCSSRIKSFKKVGLESVFMKWNIQCLILILLVFLIKMLCFSINSSGVFYIDWVCIKLLSLYNFVLIHYLG